MQYFFARHSPFKIWLTLGTLLCVAVAIAACEPTPATLMEPGAVLWLIGVALLSLPAGWLCALLAGAVVFGSIYQCRCSRYGPPFQPGDWVRILAGPHRDRVSRVYSLWQGDTVRVELGEKEKAEFKDIFSPVQLLKVQDVESESAADQL